MKSYGGENGESCQKVEIEIIKLNWQIEIYQCCKIHHKTCHVVKVGPCIKICKWLSFWRCTGLSDL